MPQETADFCLAQAPAGSRVTAILSRFGFHSGKALPSLPPMESTSTWSGRRARGARRRARLTLAALAARLSEQLGPDAPTTSTLHRWEAGDGAPRSWEWPLIARAIGCEETELLKEVRR